MPTDPPGFKSVTVRLTTDQYSLLARIGAAYEGMQPGSVARILVAFALPRSDEAMALPAKQVLEESALQEAPAPPGGKT